MLFNSLSFLFLFLPASLIFYYMAAKVNRHCAALSLVIASLIFYGWWNPAFLILLLASIAYNYGFSRLLARFDGRERWQNWILAVGIAGNLLLLFYYKYLFPLLTWLDSMGFHVPRETQSVILPLGISFFTFTQIGYLVDCKAGVAKVSRLIDYMLFVTFFPHLIAGPILHHREMMPQFADARTYRFRIENIGVGLSIFIIGLAKKVLLADQFALTANPVFQHPAGLSPFAAWGGLLSYCLQLYFDFSGYSEMAIGLGRMFGIKFPANFNSPLKATSIIEYWQRFHMTLTRYINLYVYNPVALWITRRRLAQGKPVSKQATATVPGFISMILFPTFFAMTLAGIWHGAGLQFLVFGLLHATYLTINHAWRIWGPNKAKNPGLASKILNALWKVPLTLLAVIVAQIFFRSNSMQDAMALIHDMLAMNGLYAHAGENLRHDVIESLLRDQGWDLDFWLRQIQFGAPLTVLIGYLFVWTMPNTLQIMAPYQPSLSKIDDGTKSFIWKPSIAWGLGLGLLAAVSILAVTGTSEFLYFQF